MSVTWSCDRNPPSRFIPARQASWFAAKATSGAVMASALEFARNIKEGLIVVVFPDGGDKYLTTRVWENDA